MTHVDTRGVGCLAFILLCVLAWACCVGVATPWGFYSVDLFPPALHQHPAGS